MRRDTKIFNLNHNNNSIMDLSEKSSLRDIARGTQLRRCPGAQKKSSQDYLQQGLAKIIKLTVDINKIMGIIISVDSLKGNNI
jgi:hypothetical protein|tara:strand:- start:261 stop:509 length:249 start_codon:yes stop_codon:yes gene_type:complete